MPVTLRMLVEFPCESVDDAIRQSIDQGGEALAIIVNGEIVLDPQQIRELSAQFN